MPIYGERFRFLAERQDYGRRVGLAVLGKPNADNKVQMYVLTPHAVIGEGCCLSGMEDLNMLLTIGEARELVTVLMDAGIRPY